MKNKFRAAALMAAFTLFAISCGDNNSDSVNDNAPIVGIWKYYGDYDAEQNVTDADDDDCYTNIAEFKSNGTVTDHETDCDDDYDETDTFAWQTLNNTYTQIKLTYSDDSGDSDDDSNTEIMYVRYSANQDTLIIQDGQYDLSGEVYIRQ